MEGIMKGPAAPKDPVEKRACLYAILDKIIAGSKENDGMILDHVFLEGRLKSQVQFTSGDIEQSIIDMLGSVESFRKLVHSVGVSLQALEEDKRDQEVEFKLLCYGKTEKYVSGSCMEMTIPTSGEEMVMPLSAYPINEDDDIIGAFDFVFPEENVNMSLTVKFYVNDGYEVPEIEVDPPVDFECEGYQEMLNRSLLSTGNNYRLKRVIEKAKAGEDVTIAYIGGSITQGAGAKPINTNCYAYLSYRAFCDKFSPCEGENIHYVKAGIGGTSSELGMVRYGTDVEENGNIEPDLVFIEFAVNDEGDETEGVSFESLTLRILESPQQPAVVINFAVFMNEWNLEDRIVPIGEHYNLPMVSVKQAVVPQFSKDTVITKRQYFYDIYHPGNMGHRIMSDCIAHLFDCVDEMPVDTADVITDCEPIYGNQFKKLYYFDRSNYEKYAQIATVGYEDTDYGIQYAERNMDMNASPQFAHNWMDAGTKDAEFTMKVNARNLVVVLKDSGESTYGKLDFVVDGTVVRTVDPKAVGWNHSHACIVFDEKELAEHEVSFRMHPGDEGMKASILAFGITTE